MDLGTLLIVSMISLALGIFSIIFKEKVPEGAVLFSFIGGLLAMLLFNQLNTDGSVTNAYAYTTSFQTSTTGIWPLGYLPIMFIILNWGMAIIQLLNRVRF